MCYITESQLAKQLTEIGLPTSKKQLEKLRRIGKGPAFNKWGKYVVYASDEVEAWKKNYISCSHKYTRPSY